MPEIPEIEVIRRQLETAVLHQQISEIDVQREKTLNISPGEITSALSKATIKQVLRRGKILILQFDRPVSLLFHFMLEGFLKFLRPEETFEQNYQLMLKFASGDRLYFCKMYLGYIHLEKTLDIASIPEIAELGPDPLAPGFTEEIFHTRLTSRRKMVKPLLMEQDFLAGIGNTYSNEGLFLGGILPTRKANQLTPAESSRLYHGLREVLLRAIEVGGVNDVPFSAGDHLTGGFIPEQKVNYREGEPCFVCGTPISFAKVGGRNAFYCRRCQK